MLYVLLLREEMQTRAVRDFKNGWRVFYKTLSIDLWIIILLLVISNDKSVEFSETFGVLILGSLAFFLLLSFIGFFVKYTPLSIKDGNVTIPAQDQIRTFTDILLLNPLTGYFRRRTYKIEDIENVANGYTLPGKSDKDRKWNVVITGMHNNKSFSQKIDVSNKQVRDEVRNALQHTIRGKVNSEISY